MRPRSGSQVSLFSRFLSFPTARRRVRTPRSIVAIPAESYPRYSSRLSASRIGAAAGPRPTKPTIPHIFFLPRNVYPIFASSQGYSAAGRDARRLRDWRIEAPILADRGHGSVCFRLHLIGPGSCCGLQSLGSSQIAADRHLPGVHLGALLVLLIVDVGSNVDRSNVNVTSAGATVAGLSLSPSDQEGVRHRAA